MEPESVAVDDSSTFAFLTLQENNAVAVVNIQKKSIERIFAAGIIDRAKVELFPSIHWNSQWNFQIPFDASDKDGLVNIRNYPNVYSFGMPDGIAFMNVRFPPSV